MAETKKLASFVLGPDGGESHWQPVPANGFVNNLVSTRKLGTPGRLSMGTQTVAPKSFIREHTHDKNEEIIFVVAGRGIARLEGVDYPIETRLVRLCRRQREAPLHQPARRADDFPVGVRSRRA